MPGGAALRTYIEANVEFIGAHRQEMKALLEIFLNGAFDYGPATEQAVIAPIEMILRDGQRSGLSARLTRLALPR